MAYLAKNFGKKNKFQIAFWLTTKNIYTVSWTFRLEIRMNLENLCLAHPWTVIGAVYTQCTSRCAGSMRRWFVAGAICYMLNCYQDSTICSLLLLLLRENLLQSADCYCICLLLWYMFLICSETHVTVVLMLSRCRDMCRLSHATDLPILTSRNWRPT